MRGDLKQQVRGLIDEVQRRIAHGYWAALEAYHTFFAELHDRCAEDCLFNAELCKAHRYRATAVWHRSRARVHHNAFR